MAAGLSKVPERGASKHRLILFSFESFSKHKRPSACFGDENNSIPDSAPSPGGANNRSSAASYAGAAGGGEPSAPACVIEAIIEPFNWAEKKQQEEE